MRPYDTTFDPLAAVLTVQLTGVVHHRPQLRSAALIDTGADITAIPQECVERLKLYPFGRLLLEGHDAIPETVYTYEVRMSLPDQVSQEMEVVVTPYPFVILGRDWLQGFYLYLAGPEQQMEIADHPFPIQ